MQNRHAWRRTWLFVAPRRVAGAARSTGGPPAFSASRTRLLGRPSMCGPLRLGRATTRSRDGAPPCGRHALKPSRHGAPVLSCTTRVWLGLTEPLPCCYEPPKRNVIHQAAVERSGTTAGAGSCECAAIQPALMAGAWALTTTLSSWTTTFDDRRCPRSRRRRESTAGRRHRMGRRASPRTSGSCRRGRPRR